MRAALVLALTLIVAGAFWPSSEPLHGRERDPSRAPIAVIEGLALTKAALHDYWLDRYPQEYGRTLDALIDEHIVRMRAQRDGITVPEQTLGKAIETEVSARREQIIKMFGSEAKLDVEVKRAYGVDVETWKQRILRRRLRARLLMERVIRWDTRSRARVHARVIVLADAARAQVVLRKLRQGADFSLTAVKESQDPTARAGGDLPAIARGDLAFPGVEERLFRAQPGALVGPLEVKVQGKPQWQIYKIVSRREPWTGDAAARRARLEDDLLAEPMRPDEYERWRARAHRDSGVRLYGPDGRLRSR